MTNSPIPIPDFTRVVLRDGYPVVEFHWRLSEGTLDRPHSYGMAVNDRNVPRLTRAFLEGALFENPRVAVDIDGNSYIACRCKVFGKRINKDLTALGY